MDRKQGYKDKLLVRQRKLISDANGDLVAPRHIVSEGGYAQLRQAGLYDVEDRRLLRLSPNMAYRILTVLLLPLVATAVRQLYDVKKIVQAFKETNDDLKILCAHRGLRWNGTAENSREAMSKVLSVS